MSDNLSTRDRIIALVLFLLIGGTLVTAGVALTTPDNDTAIYLQDSPFDSPFDQPLVIPTSLATAVPQTQDTAQDTAPQNLADPYVELVVEELVEGYVVATPNGQMTAIQDIPCDPQYTACPSLSGSGAVGEAGGYSPTVGGSSNQGAVLGGVSAGSSQ